MPDEIKQNSVDDNFLLIDIEVSDFIKILHKRGRDESLRVIQEKDSSVDIYSKEVVDMCTLGAFDFSMEMIRQVVISFLSNNTETCDGFLMAWEEMKSSIEGTLDKELKEIEKRREQEDAALKQLKLTREKVGHRGEEFEKIKWKKK